MSLIYDDESLKCGQTKVRLACKSYVPYFDANRKKGTPISDKGLRSMDLLSSMIADKPVDQALWFRCGEQPENSCSFFINRETNTFHYENYCSGKNEFVTCEYDRNKAYVIEFLKGVRAKLMR